MDTGIQLIPCYILFSTYFQCFIGISLWVFISFTELLALLLRNVCMQAAVCKKGNVVYVLHSFIYPTKYGSFC